MTDAALRPTGIEKECLTDGLFTPTWGVSLEPRRRTPLAAALVRLAAFLAFFVSEL
jgi:hypothetical protein